MSYVLSLALVLFLAVPLMYVVAASGGESTIEQGKDSFSDSKTSTKKLIRKAKRKLRNASGKASISKDIGDKVNDLKDDGANAIEKSKH